MGVLEESALPGWTPSEAPVAHDYELAYEIRRRGGDTQLSRNGVQIRPTLVSHTPSHWLSRNVHLDIATLSPSHVFLHAAVVKTGRGLLILPGSSHSGKSTLAEALVRQGCLYYSDEYAPVSCATCLVAPFPRSLCRRSEVGVTTIPARDLGWDSSLGPEKVRAIILTQFNDHVSRFSPTQLSKAQVVQKLFSHCVSAIRAPERALSTLSHLVEGCTVFFGERGPADAFAEMLLTELNLKAS